MDRGQYEDALREVNEAIRLDPEAADAYHNRGYAAYMLGQYERAIRDYDESIRLRDIQRHQNQILRWESLGSGTVSAASLDRVDYLRLNSERASTYHNRGLAYLELGDSEQAERDFAKAREHGYEDEDSIQTSRELVQTGGEHLLQHQYEDARRALNEAIRLDPEYAFAYHLRALSYHRLGQYERAIMDYNAAIRLDPDFARLYSDRGLSHYSMGQYERAIQDYDEAIRLDPEYAMAYYFRGSTYGIQAERDFAKARELGYEP